MNLQKCPKTWNRLKDFEPLTNQLLFVNFSSVLYWKECKVIWMSMYIGNHRYILYRYVTFSLCYPPVEGIKPLKVCHSLSVYFGVFYDTILYAQILFSFNFWTNCPRRQARVSIYQNDYFHVQKEIGTENSLL